MKNKGLYIQMFSIHGLIRSENMELGHDADTGGQIKYVIELGKALSKHKDVHRVDLLTRLISDKACSDDYSRPIETVNEKFRIVRLQCGGKKYIRKELLWPFMDEYVDKTIKFIKNERKIPDVIHGHYPDAGYVAKELARFFGLPFIYTGHSLGKPKKQRLLNEGQKEDELNKKFKIDHRIFMEEQILKSADMIVTSTRQEIDEQYGLYQNKGLPKFHVIPPGIDIEKFCPYYHETFANNEQKEESLFTRQSLIKELRRFFRHPEKPIILALCRPDKRKNIEGLVKAYGEDYDLQAIANLAVFAGIRKDISQKEDSERDVLTQMLLLIDKYNLYGKMAIPKKHDFELEVPELYRIAARGSGVFVNSALVEPFGLTLLEALACGLPVVATNDGGPKDIIDNCQGGILVDPKDTKAIAKAIKDILVHSDTWSEFSKNGIMNTRKYYTWTSHVKTYVQKIKSLHQKYETLEMDVNEQRLNIGKRFSNLHYFLITDIDNTLLGGSDESLEQLMKLLKDNKENIGFGVATGRVLKSALDILQANNIMTPDIIISGVGSEITYGESLYHDKGWENHISKNWNRDLIMSKLEDVNYLTKQPDNTQTPFKISYNMVPGKDHLPRLHHILTKDRFRYTLIYSHEKYLDILPYRASKGKAIRYLSYKWEIPLKNLLICGDSGNDEEMLKGEPAGIVVGNYSSELEPLKHIKNIYFAQNNASGGIIEGINHYKFIQKAGGTQ
ncbi:HAD-IIB family hydrolase [Desulfobacter curvatus]|uniref:HAD-IIB family hydrolase n=1 Tax=Desulfobacter curvatus TaxID=2290 RepID=UPI00037B7F96|nr:HAD-IIB family hydrolase [Desulfobacter curvatus]